MKRKTFLATILPATLALGPLSLDLQAAATEPDASLKIPPFLTPGDTIGITSPAGYITAGELEPSLQKLTEWGFKYIIGNTIGKRDFTFGGTDAERLADLQQMLDDDSIQAILCARGGYGCVRIIDGINWEKFKRKPKWIIGFSDITVLHTHINSRLNIATIHSKMSNSFPDDWGKATDEQRLTIDSIRDVLTGKKMHYAAMPNAANRKGNARGRLVGGNLKTIESMAGSASDLDTKDAILFVEDTGEYLYSIDRMFWNLKRSGKLKNLHGLVVGGFKIRKDDAGEEFGKTLEEIVLEKVAEYNYPVCFDFPVGHQRNNYALACGCMHALSITENGTTMVQI